MFRYEYPCYVMISNCYQAHTCISDVSLLVCPADYTLRYGSCYKMFDIKRNFPDARAECNKTHGGDLATFTSQDEYNYLVSLNG